MFLRLENKAIREHILAGEFGLERESLRVDLNGNLSHTPHPFGDDRKMERDFCENQTEIITGVSGSAADAWEELTRLHEKATRTIYHLESGPEVLWPFSNPPYVKGEEDIPIAKYSGNLKPKEEYRKYLAAKYGKKKMLFSGIHFNFSFPEEDLRVGFAESDFTSYQEFKDRIYLDLAKKVTRRSWLIVYLTAASPVFDGSFFRDEDLGKDVVDNYASARCSSIGYWNDFTPILNYNNISEYVDSIQCYVDEGSLRAASELYYPVRLKPRGENSLENIKKNGVNHIELRMLDLNPLTPTGIMKEDLQFLQLFLVYLTTLDDEEFDAFDQRTAVENEKAAAKFDDNHIWIKSGWHKSELVRDAATGILQDMERKFAIFERSDILDIIHFQKKKVLNPKERYAVRVKRQFEHNYVEKGLELAKQYAERIVS